VQGFFYSTSALKKLATDRKVNSWSMEPSSRPGRRSIRTRCRPRSHADQPGHLLPVAGANTGHPHGQEVNVDVAGYDYRIDDAAMASLHGFMADITKLPPPSTNYVKAFHRFVRGCRRSSP